MAKNDHTKHLGVYLDSALSYSKHVKEVVLKAQKGVSLLKYLSKYVDSKVFNLSYKLHVRPHLDYGNIIYHNQRSDIMKLIEQVQYKAALIVRVVGRKVVVRDYMKNLVGNRFVKGGGLVV